MTDGDAHPDAIADIRAIVQRGGDFARAVGALIRKRQAVIAASALDSAFENYDLPSGNRVYAISHCVGGSGVTAVFVAKKGALTLLSATAFDDFIAEALSADALNAAITVADQRLQP